MLIFSFTHLRCHRLGAFYYFASKSYLSILHRLPFFHSLKPTSIIAEFLNCGETMVQCRHAHHSVHPLPTYDHHDAWSGSSHKSRIDVYEGHTFWNHITSILRTVRVERKVKKVRYVELYFKGILPQNSLKMV
jgi:hypothetical protein